MYGVKREHMQTTTRLPKRLGTSHATAWQNCANRADTLKECRGKTVRLNVNIRIVIEKDSRKLWRKLCKNYFPKKKHIIDQGTIPVSVRIVRIHSVADNTDALQRGEEAPQHLKSHQVGATEVPPSKKNVTPTGPSSSRSRAPRSACKKYFDQALARQQISLVGLTVQRRVGGLFAGARGVGGSSRFSSLWVTSVFRSCQSSCAQVDPPLSGGQPARFPGCHGCCVRPPHGHHRTSRAYYPPGASIPCANPSRPTYGPLFHFSTP